jgi:hypothetical protein
VSTYEIEEWKSPVCCRVCFSWLTATLVVPSSSKDETYLQYWLASNNLPTISVRGHAFALKKVTPSVNDDVVGACKLDGSASAVQAETYTYMPNTCLLFPCAFAVYIARLMAVYDRSHCREWCSLLNIPYQPLNPQRGQFWVFVRDTINIPGRSRKIQGGAANYPLASQPVSRWETQCDST